MYLCVQLRSGSQDDLRRGTKMKYFRVLALLGICLASASYASAQRLAVGIGVGGPGYVAGPPACAYGYYGNYPYACAPYGYYGPSYFSGGLFIGAGPWFPGGFYGRPGFYGRGGFYGHEGFYGRGGVGGRGPGFGGRGPVGGFRGGAV